MPTETSETKTDAARPKPLDRLKSIKERRRRVRIYLDPELVDAAAEAEHELEVAREKSDTGAAFDKAEKAATAARKKADDESIVFTFRAISRGRYDELVREHPPTDKENREHKEQYGANAPYSESFGPALISECLEDPELSESETIEALTNLHNTEVLELFQTALVTCTERRTKSLGN